MAQLFRKMAFVAVAGGLALAVGERAPVAAERADVLIRGGLVYTGEAAPGRVADVALRGDRVVFVGDAARAKITAAKVIDATGLVVTPGLIDVHTHAGLDLISTDPARRAVPNHTFQGVSTVVIGNDGDGSPKIAEVAAKLDGQGVGVNVAQLVGFGAVRKAAIGEVAREPNAAELAEMKRLTAKAMCEGAFGFSAGLYYAPQIFAKTEEVIAVAREAAVRGGLYDTHMRDESSDNVGLLEGVREAIRIGREAGMPTHIAHIKAQGVDVHGKSGEVIALIEEARKSGHVVHADQYTWLASGTRVSNAIAPRWAMDGGYKALQQRLGDASLRPRLEPLMQDNLRRRGGPESILLTSGRHAGQTLGALAKTWQVDPVEAAVRIMRDEGDARIASFNMIAADMENFARQPWVLSSSDASEGHPRKFGSMPLRWRLLVKERKVLTPEQFIHRSTGLSADLYGMEGRGYLKPGRFADVLVFDPDRFRERADYVKPTELSEGVVALFINGKPVIEGGKATGEMPGQALRKARDPKWTCPA